MGVISGTEKVRLQRTRQKLMVPVLATIIILISIIIIYQTLAASGDVGECKEMKKADPVLLDIRLFTVFALLNASGFDDENRKEGMHSTRLGVHKALEGIPYPLTLRIENYLGSLKDASWHDYTRYALMIHNPPRNYHHNLT